MIQVYLPENTDYEHNGDMTLMPSSATVHAILNGTWGAELIHPIDQEGRWEYIKEEGVISMPSFYENSATLPQQQLFRIKNVTKMDSGITAVMEPIFYDSMNDCFLIDVRPTGKNGQQALDVMTAVNDKYSGSSNISDVSTAYYQYKNLMEAINGEDDNSFISRWGGEILFNNFQVIINDRVGMDKGYELRYGKNLAVDGLSGEVDTRNVVTRIYPKAYNGYMMSNNGHVDSSLIENYPVVKAVTMTFDNIKMAADASEDDKENGIIICATQEELDQALQEQCEAQFAAGIDKPKVTISANLTILKYTEQYKEYEQLEDVSLGDTIHCINARLGIETDARVIELVYDCVNKKTQSVVLGDFQKGYFDGVTSSADKIEQIVLPSGQVDGTQIAGIINMALTQLRLQNTIAQKQDVRAIRFEDLDPTSSLYGAMCLGTQGFQIANKRTADGRDWDWQTFGNATGFNASMLIAGILASQNYEQGKQGFKMNLQTGEADIPVLEIATGDLRIQITELQGDVGGLQNNVGDIQTNIEDLNTDVGNLQGDVDGINQDIDGLEQTTTQKFAQIDASVDSITQTVASVSQASAAQSEAISQLQISADNITQVVRQAIIDAGVPDLAERVAKVELEADSLSIQLTEVQKYGDTVNQVNRFFDFLQTGLKTGMDGSPFYTLLSETELGFYENGTRVAYISNNRLYINSAWVRGDFVLENVAAQKFVKQYVNSDGYFCVQAASSAG